MGVGLIDDYIRNILAIPFCPYHFVHTILSNTNLSVYHFVHTILSVPFCPLPFCPRTSFHALSHSGVEISQRGVTDIVHPRPQLFPIGAEVCRVIAERTPKGPLNSTPPFPTVTQSAPPSVKTL